MKKVHLKSFSFEANGEKRSEKYESLIRLAIEHVDPKSGGLNPVQMRKRIRVLDALAALNMSSDEAFLTLDDADAETLRQCLQDLPLAIVSKPLVDAIDDICGQCVEKHQMTATSVG